MDIIDIDEENRVMVKTSLTGTVTIGYASIDGDITFEPVTTTQAIFTGQQYLTATITEAGTGKIYEKNTLVIHEKYTGHLLEPVLILMLKHITRRQYSDSSRNED